jgi:hypothetical protein
VCIEGGDFLLNGSSGAGIGVGFAESGNSSVGVVSVKNSRIDATGMNGAGIGAGSDNDLGVQQFSISLSRRADLIFSGSSTGRDSGRRTRGVALEALSL